MLPVDLDFRLIRLELPAKRVDCPRPLCLLIFEGVRIASKLEDDILVDYKLRLFSNLSGCSLNRARIVILDIAGYGCVFVPCIESDVVIRAVKVSLTDRIERQGVCFS